MRRIIHAPKWAFLKLALAGALTGGAGAAFAAAPPSSAWPGVAGRPRPRSPDAATPGAAVQWRKTAHVFADNHGRPLCVGEDACAAGCGLEPLRAPPTALPLGGWTPVEHRDGARGWPYRGRPVFRMDGEAEAGGGWRVVEVR